MTGIRRYFGFLLCICYVWSLVMLSFQVCTCQDKFAGIDIAAETASSSSCCQSEMPSACCPSMEPEAVPSESETGQLPACCFSGEQCDYCTLCHSAKQYLPAHLQIQTEPELELTSFDCKSIDPYIVPNVSATIYHPPKRTTLAPHISTTVLLC